MGNICCDFLFFVFTSTLFIYFGFIIKYTLFFIYILNDSTNSVFSNSLIERNSQLQQAIKINFSTLQTQSNLENTMPKVTPFLEEVIYLVADLLDSLNHTKQANKLKEEFQLPEWVKKDNPLIKKGLTKILKDYINSNQKLLKYYQTRKSQSQSQAPQSQEQAPKPSKKTRKSVSLKQSPLVKPKSPKVSGAVHQQPRGWMISQFAQPKRLEDLNDDEVEVPKQAEVVIPKKKKKSKKEVKKQTSSEEESQQQTPQPKKQKKEVKKQKKQAKEKGPVDTSYLNSEEEFELEDKKTKKSATPEKTSKKQQPIKTRKKSAQIQKVEFKVEAQKPHKEFKNHVNTDTNFQDNNSNGPKKFFSRINAEQVGHIPEQRRDNTFEAKAKYGVGDAWGQYGYDKLKVTRGDSFKKTKGKLKNKAFQGSGININEINSIPIAW